MGCILGGAIGNLIDRFNHGQVTDFIEFAFISFPVFNVADALIDVGIVLLFFSIWFEPIPLEERKPKESTLPETQSPRGRRRRSQGEPPKKLLERESASGNVASEDIAEHESGSGKVAGAESAENELSSRKPTTQKTD